MEDLSTECQAGPGGADRGDGVRREREDRSWGEAVPEARGRGAGVSPVRQGAQWVPARAPEPEEERTRSV